MKSKHFLIVALVAAAGLLIATDAAQAQRGGGGRGGVGGGRGGYGYGRGGFYGGIGIGIGVGPIYGLGYDPYYVVPSVAYYPPLVPGVQVPTQPVPAIPPTPPAEATTTAAQIRVLVTDPNAKVLFDGAMTTQTGTDRLFHTPPLTGEASYRIQARWMQGGKEVAQEVVVPVAPGRMSVADFTKTGSEPLPAPKK